MKQLPDSAPGNYYVSAVDGPNTWLLLGPFMNDHAGALEMVEKVRDLANNADARSCFYAFGTVRMAEDYTKPGSANKYLMPEMKEAA